MGRLRRWKDVANVATPPDETCSEAPKTESTERFFQVENHLHLSLSLRLGAIYPEAELRRRCPQDKLPKLEKCLSDSSMLKEVAVPENLKGKEPSRQAATPKRSGPSEEDARRLKRRALSKKLCLGQDLSSLVFLVLFLCLQESCAVVHRKTIIRTKKYLESRLFCNYLTYLCPNYVVELKA